MRTSEEQASQAQNLKLAVIQEKLVEKQQKIRLQSELEKQFQYKMKNKNTKLNVPTQQREQDVKQKLMAATRLAPGDFDRTYLSSQSIINEQGNHEKTQEEQKKQQEEPERNDQEEAKEGQQGTQTD